MQNPDGTHIFNCGDKKANWYLKRNLAKIIQEQPLIIRLNFSPNGNGHANDSFYLQERQNICVCCGRDDELTKHHVVPICYRKFFPDDIKNHSAYDILPVCYECHERYEGYASKFKEKLVREYDVSKTKVMVVDTELKNVCLYASALLNYSDSIPPARRERLIKVLRKYYGKDDITIEDLEKASTIEYSTRRNGYKPEGQSIVESLIDIEDFVKRWREHFIQTMKPAYMPKYWTIDRPIERARKDNA